MSRATSSLLQNVIEYCNKARKAGPVGKGSNNSARFDARSCDTQNVCRDFQVEWRGVSPGGATSWWASCSFLLSPLCKSAFKRRENFCDNLLSVDYFVLNARRFPVADLQLISSPYDTDMPSSVLQSILIQFI